MEEKSKFAELFSEATFLALLTAGAYWIAFQYEVGYLQTFGVPPYLVEVKLESILLVGLAMSGAFWVLLAIGNLAAMLWPSHPALQEKVLRIGLMLLLPLCYLLNYGLIEQDQYLLILTIGLVSIFEFAWPVIVYRKEGSLRNRFIADADAELEPRSKSLWGRLFVIVGPTAYVLIVFILLGSLLAYSAGKAAAVNSKDYLLLAEDSDVAVVRMYSDRIICVRFNKNTKEIQPRLIIRTIEENTNLELVRMKVGPLRFPEKMEATF